jgi:cell wall-associated NlpC family hydrolase
MPPVSQGGDELTTRRRAFVSMVVTAAIVLSATPLYAVPSSKLAEAREIKKQVDRLDHKAAVADENYLQAKIKHAKYVKQRDEAAARLRKVEKRMDVVGGHLSERAESMYRTGQIGFVSVLLSAESFEEFATTWDILRELNHDDAQAIAELKDLRAKEKKARATYNTKVKAAAGQVAVMKANKKAAYRDLAERKRLLAGVEAEIAQIEASERRAQSARAASLVRTSAASERNFPPPTRAARSEVVSIAKRYLGAPYVWAADGPNSFDCSGFTMFVYRQVGVSLPHSSRAQIHYGERVSRSNLQPGDLVFFGSPIHHVGIYVGGGMMIHAPHTGAVVRIDPLHSNYSGACRP